MIVELAPSDGERKCTWEWRPDEAVPLRGDLPRSEEDVDTYEKLYGNRVKIWKDNPAPETAGDGDVQLGIQKLLAGGGYATAWHEDADAAGKRSLYISISISHSDPTAPDVAVAAVQRARDTGVAELERTHRDWWQTYYPAAFVSIPDTRLESFYWIQMYKYACVGRAETQVLDTHGPWLQQTMWPYVTWNLNTQISYWALQPANRLGIAESLFRNLDENMDELIRNVRPIEYQEDSACLGHCSQHDLICPLDEDRRYEREWGNLLWTCHNYWLQYRFSMDDNRLRTELFPLLRRAVNFHLHFVEEQDDGKLHLPPTFSPEVGGLHADCNYDLALLKWGCGALVQATERLGIDDPLLPRWRDVLVRLVDFPTDENGFMIGRDTPFDAHRHFSHLLMIFPLYLVNWDNPEDRPVIEKSVAWFQRTGKGCGYTHTGGSSMAAAMGDGNTALERFRRFEDHIFSNTMYAESGQNLETPFSAVQCINDMLIQSWGDTIRVFPAVPDAWEDAVIHDLRTEGAFLVSAVRAGGKTRWIGIKSLAGEPCRLRTDMAGPLRILAGCEVDLRQLDPGTWEIAIDKGQEIVIGGNDAPSEFVVAPLPASSGGSNTYGVRE